MINVVIVDDELWVTELIKNLVDWDVLGFKILATFNDSNDAYGFIVENQPDLVLTDIRMPVLDGLELLRKSRLKNIISRFIIISGYGEFNYAKKAISYDVLGYLLKPIDADELTTLLSKAKKVIEEEKETFTHNENLRFNLHAMEKERVSQYFFDFLKSGKEFDEESLTNYNISFDGNSFLVAIIACEILNNYADANYISISQIVENSLQSLCCQIITFPENKRIVVVLNYNQINSFPLSSKLKYLRSTLEQTCEKQIHKGVFLAIGKEAYNISQLTSSYYTAKQMLYSRVLYENVNFLDANKTEIIFEPKKAINPLYKARIVESISEYDSNKAKHDFLLFITYLKKDFTISPFLIIEEAHWVVEEYKSFYENVGIKVNNFSTLLDNTMNAIDASSNLNELVNTVNNFIDYISLKSLDKSNKSRLIDAAKEYIKDNYNKDISLKEVADKVYLSPSYFSELFKLETEKTFKEYLISYRVVVSKEMLKDASLTISTIATKVGYKDEKFFSKVFKKHVGITPSSYRKLVSN